MPHFAETTSIMIGDIKVTYLADGVGVASPLATFPTTNLTDWEEHKEVLDGEGNFITSIGGFLIESADHKIAVDTAIGPVALDFPGFGRYSGGEYLQSLQRAGVSPDEITDVVFTHMHVDHVGWTTVEENGKRRLLFPNARYRLTDEEWSYWYGGDNPAGPDRETVQEPLAERIEAISGGNALAPGVTVVSTPGHTPGHISLVVNSGEHRLFLIGDVMYGTHQMQEPGWPVAFDADPALARKTREGLLPDLVMEHTIVAAHHFSDMVFGRVTAYQDAYRWRPLT